MAIALRLPRLRAGVEHAIEIVPPRWVDDEEILRLGSRHEHLTFERFSDGTLLISPLPGWMTSNRNGHLFVQVFGYARAHRGLALGPDGGIVFPHNALLRPV